MSEAPDPLEAELSALRPHEVSPGLRHRLAQRLADAPPASPPRPSPPGRRGASWGWWLACAGGLAAACLAAVLFWLANGRHVEPKRRVNRPHPRPPAPTEDAEPTLLAYQRALARSPEQLEALLNRHPTLAPEPNPALVPVGKFSRSDAALHDLIGED
jgi:hypothetical protein